jgi:hypothetical protein
MVKCIIQTVEISEMIDFTCKKLGFNQQHMGIQSVRVRIYCGWFFSNIAPVELLFSYQGINGFTSGIISGVAHFRLFSVLCSCDSGDDSPSICIQGSLKICYHTPCNGWSSSLFFYLVARNWSYALNKYRQIHIYIYTWFCLKTGHVPPQIPWFLITHHFQTAILWLSC